MYLHCFATLLPLFNWKKITWGSVCPLYNASDLYPVVKKHCSCLLNLSFTCVNYWGVQFTLTTVVIVLLCMLLYHKHVNSPTEILKKQKLKLWIIIMYWDYPWVIRMLIHRSEDVTLLLGLLICNSYLIFLMCKSDILHIIWSISQYLDNIIKVLCNASKVYVSPNNVNYTLDIL